MIDHYQPFSFPFLGSHASVPSPLVKRYYYWSFEDGLWDLLRAKLIEQGSTILVPDFYCSDVIDNIRAHGYTVTLYKLNKYFQVKKQTLLNSIKRCHPAVVVVFHACGIKSTVMTNPTWIKKLKNTIILEDSVHLLLTPSLVKPMSDTHFIMDSLRKVSPFHGSFLYGTKKGMQFHQAKKMWSLYTVYSLFLYWLFRVTLISAHILNQPNMAIFAHEKLLKSHDNVIGDSIRPYRGISLFFWLTQWIETSKVERMKREQVQLYEKICKPLWGRRSPFYRIQMKRNDYRLLHAYPVGLQGKAVPDLIAYLRNSNIVVFPKYSDSQWAKKHDVLFFPLGFHIKKQDIKLISKKLIQWKNGSWKKEHATFGVMHSPHFLMRAASLFISQ